MLAYVLQVILKGFSCFNLKQKIANDSFFLYLTWKMDVFQSQKGTSYSLANPGI